MGKGKSYTSFYEYLWKELTYRKMIDLDDLKIYKKEYELFDLEIQQFI